MRAGTCRTCSTSSTCASASRSSLVSGTTVSVAQPESLADTRGMSEEQKAQQTDEQQVEDLEVAKEEAQEVKGGRKAGKDQQEYYKVTMSDVIISS
jgi:hypothetical protein